MWQATEPYGALNFDCLEKFLVAFFKMIGQVILLQFFRSFNALMLRSCHTEQPISLIKYFAQNKINGAAEAKKLDTV